MLLSLMMKLLMPLLDLLIVMVGTIYGDKLLGGVGHVRNDRFRLTMMMPMTPATIVVVIIVDNNVYKLVVIDKLLLWRPSVE